MPDPVAPPAAPAVGAGATPPPAAPAGAATTETPKPGEQVAAPPAQPPAPAPKEEAKPPAPPAPLEVKLPEGAKVDQKALDAFKGIMQDEKLSPQDRAQKLIDLQFQQAQEAQQAAEAAWPEQAKAIRTADMERLKADKEWGGARTERTIGEAQLEAKRWFGEEFAKYLVESAQDSRPELVIGLARIHAAVSEDATSARLRGPPPAAPVRPLTQNERMQAALGLKA